MMSKISVMLVSGVLAAAGVQPVSAQLPDPSAAALGVAESHTAWARGFSAVALNPAGLAMPGNPAASGTFAAVRVVGGIGPVGLGDLADFEGELLPADVQQLWLDRITRAGGEEGSAGADLTYVAAQFGRVGFQVSTTADLVANLGPGAAELILFGNAGRTGEPIDIALESSSFDVAVASTFALGYGHPLISTTERSLSLGATVKYTVGHLMLAGLDLGGGATADPLAIGFEFPIVQTDTALEVGPQNRGAGVGLDLGVAWREGSFLGGLTLRNVFNTFEWNEDHLFFRAGAVRVGEETRATDFEPQPYSEAPAPIRARVGELTYSPVLTAGVGYELGEAIRLSADLRQRLGDGLPAGAATHFGTGVEYRPLSWLPLRAGGAVISGGYLLSAGAGLHAGPVRLDVAAARRSADLGTASMGMVTFSLISR